MNLAALQEMQFDDVELYITVFFKKHEAVDFLEWQENQKVSVFFLFLQIHIRKVDSGGEPL